MNWNWGKSIIEALRNKETTRERFIREWSSWQKAQGFTVKKCTK